MNKVVPNYEPPTESSFPTYYGRTLNRVRRNVERKAAKAGSPIACKVAEYWTKTGPDGESYYVLMEETGLFGEADATEARRYYEEPYVGMWVLPMAPGAEPFQVTWAQILDDRRALDVDGDPKSISAPAGPSVTEIEVRKEQGWLSGFLPGDLDPLPEAALDAFEQHGVVEAAIAYRRGEEERERQEHLLEFNGLTRG